MNLVVRQGDREEHVGVRREGDIYEITVGDRTYRVDAAAARPGLYSLRIDGAQHEVAAHRQGEGIYRLSTARGSAVVAVADPLSHLAAQTRGGPGDRRRQTVRAYMPGRVVTLLVQEGQEVAGGQGVLVLEAMKMENEIRAEHDGKVIQFHVQPGQAVESGNPLFELE